MSESEIPNLKIDASSGTTTSNELKISKLFRRSPSPSPTPTPSPLPSQKNQTLMVQPVSPTPVSLSPSNNYSTNSLYSSSSSATGEYTIFKNITFNFYEKYENFLKNL